VLQSFKPLLDAIGRGPPLTEEVDWLWRKTMKWNDVDAEVKIISFVVTYCFR
jgi:hypothetical protein